MARNFSGTATTGGTTLTITGSTATEVYVKNTGGNALRVNVPLVHGSADYDTVAAGDTGTYSSSGSIGQILVKTDSSTTTYTAGVTKGIA